MSTPTCLDGQSHYWLTGSHPRADGLYYSVCKHCHSERTDTAYQPGLDEPVDPIRRNLPEYRPKRGPKAKKEKPTKPRKIKPIKSTRGRKRQKAAAYLKRQPEIIDAFLECGERCSKAAKKLGIPHSSLRLLLQDSDWRFAIEREKLRRFNQEDIAVPTLHGKEDLPLLRGRIVNVSGRGVPTATIEFDRSDRGKLRLGPVEVSYLPETEDISQEIKGEVQ